MDILGEVLKYTNLGMSLWTLFVFALTAKRSTKMRPIMVSLSINSAIMAALYTMILCGAQLPDITGRVNLFLILLSLSLASKMLWDMKR